MSYIGLEPSNSFVSLKRQVITGNGGTSYTLDHSVASVNDVAIFVNNVRQDPAGYSISGAALTLGGTIESSDDCYVIFLGQALQTVTPDANTITTAMIQDSAVTSAKLASGNLTIPNGNLLFDTADKGIYLGVTSATAANLLDDYEKGTYTAGVFDALSGGNQSGTTATGQYTKIGRVVNFNVAFANINTTGLTGSNRIFVSLPFASINGQTDAQTSPFVKNVTFNDYLIFGESSSSQKSRYGFISINSAGASASTTVSNFTDDDNYCSISLTYITDD